MAVRFLDLRQRSERIIFENSTDEDVRYAEGFWQSVKLQPTMESRLVSSDIKQRIGKRNTSSKSGASAGQSEPPVEDIRQNALFVRARTLDQIERFQRLNKLADARVQDRNMLHRRREERIKKELISREKFAKPISYEDIARQKAEIQRKIGEAYTIEEMFRDIDQFEKKKHELNQNIAPPGSFATTFKKGGSLEPEITVLVSPIGKRRSF